MKEPTPDITQPDELAGTSKDWEARGVSYTIMVWQNSDTPRSGVTIYSDGNDYEACQVRISAIENSLSIDQAAAMVRSLSHWIAVVRHRHGILPPIETRR
jgi:hypothetical protein